MIPYSIYFYKKNDLCNFLTSPNTKNTKIRCEKVRNNGQYFILPSFKVLKTVTGE